MKEGHSDPGLQQGCPRAISRFDHPIDGKWETYCGGPQSLVQEAL